MREVSESDWKVLRRLHPIALDRYCQHVLEEIEQLSSALSESPHHRYLNVYEVMQKRDAEMSQIFDDLRRSRAFQCVALLKSRGLITPEEFGGFSAELRSAIDLLHG